MCFTIVVYDHCMDVGIDVCVFVSGSCSVWIARWIYVCGLGRNFVNLGSMFGSTCVILARCL